MAKKSIKKNYIYNVVYQVLTLLTPLITTPYVSRVLSAEGIGEYSFTASVVSYFVLFATLGTTTYGEREISYSQNDRKKRSKVFWEIEFLSCVTVALTIIAYIVFLSVTGFRIIYLVQIFSILSVAVDISWLFTGLEDFKATVTRNIIFKLINIAFLFLAVRSKNDLIIYVFGLCFIQFLSSVALWPLIKGVVDKVPLKQLHPFKHLATDLTLFVPTVAIQVYTVLDKTMIGAITKSNAENGYYEQAQKISKIALTLVTALGTVMIPRIGSYFAEGDKKKIREYMYKAYNFVWMLGIPLCFGLIGISGNLIPWFLGNGFEKSEILLCTLSFLILSIGINNVTGMQYMIPTKKQNLFTVSVCIGAVANFSLNALMIPHLASLGAAIASVIAETTIAIVQFVMVRQELSGWKVLSLSWKYLISGGLMLVLLLWENRVFNPSIIHTIIMIISGGLLYLAMMIILRDKFFIDNINSALSMVKSKIQR